MGSEGLARGPYGGGRKDHDRKAHPPSREEEYRWAVMKLEDTIDKLAENPLDRVLVLSVIRLKRELVEARERLPAKKKKKEGKREHAPVGNAAQPEPRS